MVMEKMIPLTMMPQAMEVAEFNELRPLFAPMLHTVSIALLSIIVFSFIFVVVVMHTLDMLNIRYALSTRPASSTTPQLRSSSS